MVFGTLTVALLYFLKDYIGKIGVLFSALFLAVSPTFVYYSRQYTGYPFFLFFLLWLIIVVLKFLKEFKTHQIYLIFILSAILFNINETFVVFLFVVFAFSYINHLFDKNFLKKLLKKIKWKHVFLGTLVFVIVFVALHTSFFSVMSNLNRLLDVQSDIATKSVSTGHNKPFIYYFTILFPYEFGLLLIGFIGLLMFNRDRFSLFIILWSIVYLGLFSIVSYKTNWTLLVIAFPLILLFGNTLNYLFGRFKSKSIIVLGILLVLISFILSVQQNYLVFNDFERNDIGYVESSPDLNRLAYDVKNYAKSDDIRILITAHAYWPLPSYLKEYDLMYFTEVKRVNLSSDYDVFISDKRQVGKDLSGFDVKEYTMRNNYAVRVLYRKP
jgi:uncharacterized protein (TIGR03663 family)